jgi:Tfp pilus assembly protein PilF
VAKPTSSETGAPYAKNQPRGDSSSTAESGAVADVERGKKALATKHPGEAIAAFERAFAASPDLRTRHRQIYAKALTEEGRRLLDADSDAAAQRLEDAVAADPDSFDAHFLLAKVYTRKSAPEAALREYQEAVRIDPRSADAQFNLGFVYFSQKRYQEARHQYEKVVELNPPYLADVFYNLSACYEHMKRRPEAVAALRRGLEAVPTSDLLRRRLRQLGG